jgi:hypothetical protein
MHLSANSKTCFKKNKKIAQETLDDVTYPF